MVKIIATFFCALALLGAVFYISNSGWDQADRSSAHLAPSPQAHPEAVLQAYSAPLWGWRGYVADHTWIATKPSGVDFYTVYEVLGWRKWSQADNSVLRMETDIPDRLWYGNKPTVLIDIRGKKADQLIDKVHKSALSYPYKTEYSMAFGPNSNTFTAWIACQVPELNLELSKRAIGKNYLKTCPRRP